MIDLLRQPPGISRNGVYVAASILSADFARMGKECAAVLETLPRQYLQIFTREPYVQWEWSARLLELRM